MNSVFDEVKQTTLYYQVASIPTSYSSTALSFQGSFASSSNALYNFSQVSSFLAYDYKSFLENIDPDTIVKPLDIVKTSKGKIIHTGIYLGKGKVVHNLGIGIEITD
jgi:hypothetical protein